MSELQQVMTRLDRVDAKQDDALERLARLTTASEDRDRRVEGLEAAVYGNGKAGLKMEVTTIRTLCEQRHAPRPGMTIVRGVVQTVIAAVILAVAAAIMGLWKSHS